MHALRIARIYNESEQVDHVHGFFLFFDEGSRVQDSLPSTSVGPRRMDEQRNSSTNGQALDEKSIRD
jgi:hypothetical protein